VRRPGSFGHLPDHRSCWPGRSTAVDALLEGLTAEQRAVVLAPRRVVRVVAGAGSGKTLVLARAAAHRLASGRARPGRVLMLTFGRDAARHLARRVALATGTRDAGVEVLTFHAFAARHVPGAAARFLDEEAQERLGGDLLRWALAQPAAPHLRRALGLAPGDPDAAARLLGVLAFAKTSGDVSDAALGAQFPGLARAGDAVRGALERYEHAKAGRLDFDDLVLALRDRLAHDRAARDALAARYDAVFVDEYQDVNRAQHEVVLALAGAGAPPDAPRPDVLVVGDPRQSIYAFRGTRPRFLDGFLDAFDAAEREGLVLSTSFRVPAKALACANALFPERAAEALAPASDDPGAAPAWVEAADDEAEAALVADRVAALLAAGADPAEVAVLARTRRALAAYRLAAAKRTPDGEVGPAHAQVSTIHAAKGLEWDHVFLLAAREGSLPASPALVADPAHLADAVAEERRLFYVALTRARRAFVATCAPTAKRGASRFLAEAGVAREAPVTPTATTTRRSGRATP